MDVQLVSDEIVPEGQVVVVDVRGVDTSATRAVIEHIRATWAPYAGHDVDGAGEDRPDGAIRWTFTFRDHDEGDRELPVGDDEPAGVPHHQSAHRTISTAADQDVVG